MMAFLDGWVGVSLGLLLFGWWGFAILGFVYFLATAERSGRSPWRAWKNILISCVAGPAILGGLIGLAIGFNLL